MKRILILHCLLTKLYSSGERVSTLSLKEAKDWVELVEAKYNLEKKYNKGKC